MKGTTRTGRPDIDHVREVLPGWTVERVGRGVQRHLEAHGPDAAWVIQRRDGSTFRLFRLSLEVDFVWPKGRYVADDRNRLDILTSARRAAEVLALLYRPETDAESSAGDGGQTSPEDGERLLGGGRQSRCKNWR